MTIQDLIDEWSRGVTPDVGRRLAAALAAVGPVLSQPPGCYPAVYRAGPAANPWWVEARVIPEASEPLDESGAGGPQDPTPADFEPAAATAARLGLPLASAVPVPD